MKRRFENFISSSQIVFTQCSSNNTMQTAPLSAYQPHAAPSCTRLASCTPVTLSLGPSIVSFHSATA